MHDERGVTYIEIVVTLAVLGILFGLATTALSKLQQSIARNSSDKEILHILTDAARKARYGSEAAGWGVYIPYDPETRTTTTITVFSGPSYETRNPDYDTVYTTNQNIRFVNVDFSGANANETDGHEIHFTALTGATDEYGSITVAWQNTEQTLVIDPEGFIIRQ